MQLFEIGIRTKAESRKRLIEIAQGRRFDAQKQPKIWRISEHAAIKYMRDHNIDMVKLFFFNEGVSHSSLVDLSKIGGAVEMSVATKQH